MNKLVVLVSLLVSTVAYAAGPAYEYQVVIVPTMPGGKKATRELDEAMETAAKAGWRLVSTSAIIDGSVVSSFLYFEKGGPVATAPAVPSAVVPAAPVEPTPAPTPRPDRTPRPAPSNDPCVNGTPCIVETFLGSEVTIEVGKKYNVKLKSGDLFNGTITSAKRLEITVDQGAKGSRTVTSEMLSSLTPL